MDAINGRDSSEASSDSSDFYSTEYAPLAIQGPPDATTREMVLAAEESDADSSSDMDLSEPSSPSTPAVSAHVLAPAVLSTGASHAGAKRKLGDAEVGAGVTDEQTKKRKVNPANAARLPPAIWQRIFALLAPAMLCRCLRVCKDFNHMLTATKAPQPLQKDKSTARIVDSEAIWTQSRKNFFPALPRPLLHYTELDMLKLLGGQNCQFCGKAPISPPATNPFNCGPGMDGVRVIFPFGVRTCGLCIEPQLRKDVKLLAEPTSARLRLGIAHAYRNEEFHFVTESVRQAPPGIPGNLRFSKVYYQPHLAAIQQEEDDAQQLGQGAAEEWRKGLYNKGKTAMADSARWEKWEASLRLGTSLPQVLKYYDLSSFPHRPQDIQSRSAGVSTAQLPMMANGPHPLPQPVHVFPNGYQPPFSQFQQQPRPALPQQHLPFQPQPLHQQQPYPPQQPQHQRLRRNPQEAESARQARRAEIERRCRELEPPVEANVLQHMDSFRAAMQIVNPLTEAAWEMLKPRILAQREAAELAEHTRASQLAALQAAMPSHLSEEIISKPAKDLYDREHEDAQMPLRNKLGEYADDIINGHWGGGEMLVKENVPIFTIQVLQHINQRYAEDKELGLLPDFGAAAKKTLPRQGSPPPAPFLSLDNMKWVYDHKVRPLTDKLRKEHFICAGCEEEKKPKWFAFEGLIQHYGAKHTSAFSKGNIVVHWQTAEWPDIPPFHTNPAQWLRPHRGKSDFRKEHRPRSTPQNHHQGSFQGFITGSVPVAKPPTHSHQRLDPFAPQGSSNGHPSGVDQAAIAAMQAGHEAQHLQLASDSREIWDALDGVPDMLECIRVQTALHHAVAKFAERHHCKPTLDLLTDALASHNSMRPLKNVTGLACRSCVAAGQFSHSTSYWTRIQGVKLIGTSSLVTHFKLMHQPHERPASTDWLNEMIELPEDDYVKQLLRTRGMDDAKLALVASAFPSAFPTPLPRIGHITEDVPQHSANGAPASNLFGRLSKKQKSNGKKKGQKPANVSQGRDNSNESLPEPKEDEYDPLRPALIPTQSYDPAQFDTDARKPSAPEAPVAQSSSGLNLNPDTIAMLQYLEQYSQPPRAPIATRMSRSPSVGRPKSANASNAPAPAPSSTINGQPDIGAILAALAAQGQAAAPPTSASNRSASVHGQAVVNGHGKESREGRSSARNGSHATASRPNIIQHALPHVSDANDPHGNHMFEHTPYPAHTHAAAQQPHYRTAPQFQYRYENDRAYVQAAQNTPLYSEHPQPQYLQISDGEYGYQYDRPPANPVYVDQYGRPLIRVDAAPALIQYVPNPHEQQQQYSVHREYPVYATVAAQPHQQPVYDDRRPVYYEQAASAVPTRYTYEERASVGRP